MIESRTSHFSRLHGTKLCSHFNLHIKFTYFANLLFRMRKLRMDESIWHKPLQYPITEKTHDKQGKIQMCVPKHTRLEPGRNFF